MVSHNLRAAVPTDIEKRMKITVVIPGHQEKPNSVHLYNTTGFSITFILYCSYN